MRLDVALILATAFLEPTLLAQESACMVLREDGNKALTEYVRKKYRVPQTVSLTLTEDSLDQRSCFHALTFHGESTINKWDLKLYLTPDLRYLTSDVFDTQLDPILEEHRKSQILMAGLADNKGASTGSETAPVTIVEFADFQCPACRRFASVLAHIPAEDKSKIRLVFHHLPLTVHPWARTAALGAACAQLQSSEVFWALHDQLFDNQNAISADNVRTKLVELAKGVKGLDLAAYQNCLDNDLSLGLVFRDMNLATTVNVNATPTLFINGRRLEGIKDEAQLRELIAEAARESPTATTHSR